MSEPFFASGYMRLLYRFLQLEPAQELDFFASTSVSAAQLLEPNPAIEFADQMQICRNALAIQEPGLGLRMGAQLQLAAHGSLGTARRGEKLV